MAPSTIFFDFGGTLARVPTTIDRPWKVWVGAARSLDLVLSETLVQQALEVVDEQVGADIYQYVGRMPEYWRIYDGLVMDRLRVRDHREELARAVDAVFNDPSNVQLYPETREVLEALRTRGYHLGLISNHHDGLLKVLEYHGLNRLLETVTYSQEVGAEKPDPAVFAKALERARCEPSEALHVGDSIHADVDGAHRSGIEAVWLDRNHEASPVDCLTIHSLEELAHALDLIHGAASP
jgi:2-haloalkanoic acid dehalogenase type II